MSSNQKFRNTAKVWMRVRYFLLFWLTFCFAWGMLWFYDSHYMIIYYYSTPYSSFRSPNRIGATIAVIAIQEHRMGKPAWTPDRIQCRVLFPQTLKHVKSHWIQWRFKSCCYWESNWKALVLRHDDIHDYMNQMNTVGGRWWKISKNLCFWKLISGWLFKPSVYC